MSSKPLRVLFVGGTGTISASCARSAVARGMEVTVFNRARSRLRPLPPEVVRLTGDVRDPSSLRAAIEGHDFDIVVNFLCYSADDARSALGTFRGRTGHYLHISTALLYQKPPRGMPYRESTERHNPFWSYARDKIAAEDVLTEAYLSESFPVTIVRPSHTYDEVQPPVPGDWTVMDRLARGDEVVVPGEGTSLWTLTHALDFAQGLLGLFANSASLGEAFHITSDDVTAGTKSTSFWHWRWARKPGSFMCRPSSFRSPRRTGTGPTGSSATSVTACFSTIPRSAATSRVSCPRWRSATPSLTLPFGAKGTRSRRLRTPPLTGSSIGLSPATTSPRELSPPLAQPGQANPGRPATLSGLIVDPGSRGGRA